MAETPLTTFLAARLDDDEQLAQDVTADTSQGRAFEFDPERILRDVRAKRVILGAYRAFRDEAEAQRSSKGEVGPSVFARWNQLGEVIRLLATAYSDHPDYDGAWMPNG